MKKFAFPAFCISLLFFSCSKSGSSPAGSGISATIDGVNENFKIIELARNATTFGDYSLYLTGRHDTSVATSDAMALVIGGTQAIIKGTYSLNSTGTTVDLPGLAYLQGGSTVYSTYVSGVNSLTITITSLSSTNVQGTFSGTLILSAGISAVTTKTITNGKFNVNLQ